MEDLTTKFDTWYKSASGDPWGYDHSVVIRSRISQTIDFIRKYCSPDYSGAFVDLGGFDGSVSLQLVKYFEKATIYFNDVSTIAIEKAKKKLAGYSQVHYSLKDMSVFTLEEKPKDVTILLLECLYYADDEGRKSTIENISKGFPGAPVFISAPCTGGKYFTKESLAMLMEEHNYELLDHHVLNLKGHLGKIQNKFIKSLLGKNFPNQIVFLFKPKIK